jgi:N-acetylneuraminate synthase/N,N'-diacetyllegionaminate synthase
MQIDSRTIGTGQPTLVIAEIGVNHDGSLVRALELVRAAATAGADAVKLQVFRATQLMHGSSRFAEYQSQRVDDASPAEMLRRYELSMPDLATIVAAIRSAGLIPLATPFSPADVGVVESLDLPAVKIASPDLVNRPLLRRAIQTRRPILCSTGAATTAEIAATLAWASPLGASIALLHCVSSYPVGDGDAHLGWIGELSARFDVPVGYSDHTTDLLAGALAVAAGACVVEKHLTYDRAADGPDHSASADPEQFAQYVAQIRRAERLRGAPGKRVLECERDVRTVSRQSLVLRRSLEAGEAIRPDDLTVQRPGTGIPAAAEEQVVGRAVRSRQPAGTLLQWGMLADAA